MNWKLVSMDRANNPSRLVFTCKVDEDYTARLLVYLDGNMAKDGYTASAEICLDHLEGTQSVAFISFAGESKFAVCVSMAKTWASASIGELLSLERLFSREVS